MAQIDTYDLIEAYAQGKLMGDARRKFEEQLEIDPILKEEYRYIKSSQDVFIDERTKAIRQLMIESEKPVVLKESIPFIIHPDFKILMVAIVALIGFSVIVFAHIKTNSGPQITTESMEIVK